MSLKRVDAVELLVAMLFVSTSGLHAVPFELVSLSSIFIFVLEEGASAFFVRLPVVRSGWLRADMVLSCGCFFLGECGIISK